MKKTLLTSLCAVVALLAAANETITVKASKITSIDASAGVTVNYTPGENIGVSVSVAPEMKPFVEVRMQGNELFITTKNKVKGERRPFMTPESVVATVTAPAITDFEVSSGASINVLGTLDISNSPLEIEASSGASVTANGVSCRGLDADISSGASITVKDLKTANLQAEASSGASMTISGTASKVDFEVSSGASIDASGLMANKGNAEVTSGSTLLCNVKSLWSDADSTSTLDNKQ